MKRLVVAVAFLMAACAATADIQARGNDCTTCNSCTSCPANKKRKKGTRKKQVAPAQKAVVQPMVEELFVEEKAEPVQINRQPNYEGEQLPESPQSMKEPLVATTYTE